MVGSVETIVVWEAISAICCGGRNRSNVPTISSISRLRLEINIKRLTANGYKLIQVGTYKMSGCDSCKTRYLVGWMANPEPWWYSDGDKVIWELGRFVDTYGAPLSDDEPPAMAQHDDRWQTKGVLQAFEEWHQTECTDVNGRGVCQCA